MKIQHQPYILPMLQAQQKQAPSLQGLTFLSPLTTDLFQKSVRFGDKSDKTNAMDRIPKNVINLTYDSVLLKRIAPELLHDHELAQKLLQEIPNKDTNDKDLVILYIGRVLRENPEILERLSHKIARAFADEACDFTFDMVKKIYNEGTDARGRWITRGRIYSTLMSQNPASIFYWQRGEDGRLEYTAALYQFPEEPTAAEIRNVYYNPDLRDDSLNRKLPIKLITKAKQAGIKTLIADARPLEVPLFEGFGFRAKGEYIEGSIWMELNMDDTFY